MIQYYAIPGLKDCKIKFKLPERIDIIIAHVCTYFGIERKEIMERNRRRDLVDARTIAMHFISTETYMNKSAIAKVFNMDHTSVIFGLRRYYSLLNDGEFSKAVKYVQSLLT